MAYYTIYVGGERRDRETTDEDRRNVQRVLAIMDASRCYTMLRDGKRTIGQAEHVLDALISISYISSPADVEHIKLILASAGVTACTVVTCTDEECFDETGSVEVSLEQPATPRAKAAPVMQPPPVPTPATATDTQHNHEPGRHEIL